MGGLKIGSLEAKNVETMISIPDGSNAQTEIGQAKLENVRCLFEERDGPASAPPRSRTRAQTLWRGTVQLASILGGLAAIVSIPWLVTYIQGF